MAHISGSSTTSTPVIVGGGGGQLRPPSSGTLGDPSSVGGFKLGPFYTSSGLDHQGGGPTIGLYHPSSQPPGGPMPNGGGTMGGMGGGGAQGVNPNDYDINVHTIKNMLMTTRVPESCV